MIQPVFSAALPVSESLVINKNHITGTRKNGPRIAVVSGMYGEELEGQFVAYELARRLNLQPGDLQGTVDIYPALNPLGLTARERGVPQFDIDLDHTFPGNPDGNLTEALAAAVFEDIAGANACVVVHSSNAHVREIPQVRLTEHSDQLLRLASLLNARLVWARKDAQSLESTLAHALNKAGTPTLVVEMGSGMSLSTDDGAWLVEGILRLLEEMRGWSGATIAFPFPLVSDGSGVATMLAEEPGLFLASVEHGAQVSRGQLVGHIINPLEGVVRRAVHAPCNGLLFTLRSYPVVYPGSLLGRILERRS